MSYERTMSKNFWTRSLEGYLMQSVQIGHTVFDRNIFYDIFLSASEINPHKYMGYVYVIINKNV